MRSLRMLIAAFTIVLGSVSPGERVAALPSTLPPNVLHSFGWMNCAFSIRFGQYGSAAYSQVINNGPFSGCRYFGTAVYTTGGGSDDASLLNPPVSSTIQADVVGTQAGAAFAVRAEAYGLTCEFHVQLHSNGNVAWHTVQYISGFGSCPAI